MTEYEVIDALNSTMANAWTVSQYALTIITGYLLIAHFIGKQLSSFQVWFMSIVFVVMHVMNIVSLIGISRKVQLLEIELVDTGSSVAAISIIRAINSGDAIRGHPIWQVA
jgi:hypothetical protein